MIVKPLLVQYSIIARAVNCDKSKQKLLTGTTGSLKVHFIGTTNCRLYTTISSFCLIQYCNTMQNDAAWIILVRYEYAYSYNKTVIHIHVSIMPHLPNDSF